MSTQATPTPQTGKFTTERFELAYGIQTKDDGKTEAVVLSPEKAEELSAANKFNGSVVTASVDYPASWEGLLDYANKTYTDEDGKPRDIQEVKNEIVKLFVAGAKGKVMNRARARLTKQDEQGNLTFDEKTNLNEDGVLDLTPEITSGSKRVFLTEEQKTWRSLENLPSAIRQQMFNVYLQSIGKEPYTPQE